MPEQMIPDTALTDGKKTLLEFFRVGHDNENQLFLLALSSGPEINVWAVLPRHMKLLVGSLAHQVAEYEKIHGEIDAKFDPNIVSPIQPKK